MTTRDVKMAGDDEAVQVSGYPDSGLIEVVTEAGSLAVVKLRLLPREARQLAGFLVELADAADRWAADNPPRDDIAGAEPCPTCFGHPAVQPHCARCYGIGIVTVYGPKGETA